MDYNPFVRADRPFGQADDLFAARKGKKGRREGKTMKANKMFLVFGVLLVTACSFSGCERIKAFREKAFGDKGKPGGAAGEKPVPVFAVNTTTAVHGQIQDYIALAGDIVAGSTVDVYSEAAGKIAEVYVTVGQVVGRGQSVAAVDPSRPGMVYRWSMAAAPINGTIIALPAQVGMTISQAVPLARISGGGGLEIKLYVAERFISKMAMNLSCVVTLDAWPGEVFQGSISEVAPTVDPVSRTMEVRVAVRNPGNKLKAGMFAKVRIITESKDNIVKIPASAALSRFGEQYVYVVEKDPSDPQFNIVKKRIITPGILIDGALEIQSGLESNEEIVTRGQTLLEDGVRVNVIERTAPLQN
jgi:multidrug efflux pump subunit AcrA (membrane-fusion protein)